MIVESPNKIKKIKGYLGSGWTVKASVGHIRDLPSKEMGIAEDSYKPIYEISVDKRKVVKELKEAASKASEVYLATDPDREGEAIAFHLAEVLKLKNPIRVTFSEVTKSAINKAIEEKHSIDYNLVRAQEGRRVLDRMVGYTVSPILSKQSGIPLSAGRVQTPAVKIIVIREKEISMFRVRNFYVPSIKTEDGIIADLDIESLIGSKYIYDESIAKSIIDQIEGIKVSSIDKSEKNALPPAPLCTSSIQQSASKIFKITPAKTMEHCQSLFEKGLITYHRTDSQNLSPDGFEMACDFLEVEGIPTSQEQIKFKSKSGSQEAHEAIRPTSFDNLPEDIEGTKDAKTVYEMIYERALLSAMQPGKDFVVNYEFESIEKIDIDDEVSHAKFTCRGKVTKEKGWREYANIFKPNSADVILPEREEGYIETSFSSEIKDKKTSPPKRYTEATLISALDKLNIGRPSTYASILENIKKRKYIALDKKGIITPTDTGVAINDSLEEMSFTNLDYTKKLEEYLDDISIGKISYTELMEAVDESLKSEIGTIKIPLLIDVESCPKCNEDIKIIKKGKDAFWVHIADDHGCEKYISDKSGKPVIKEIKLAECPKCSEEIKRIEKGDNAFWVHTNNEIDDCKKFISDKEGSPIFIEEIESSCPLCGELIIRKEKNEDVFWVHKNTEHSESCEKYLKDERVTRGVEHDE